jgi:hypothetical protein
MRKKGFEYKFYWYNQTPLNEPSLLLEDISRSDGFIGLGLHTYRVIDFKDPEIMTDNPEDSSNKLFNIYGLIKEFNRLDGGFGLINKLK